jgi:hypothetical protein
MGRGSTSAGAMARSSRYASRVWTAAASRCQPGRERRNIPSGMCSRQKPIGRPTTTVSTLCCLAKAAVDRA